jgi:Flp pilus assembly pilin Flp
MRLRTFLRRCLRRTDGQDLIEYVMLAAFIAVLAYAAIGPFGTSVSAWFNKLGSYADEKKSNCGPTGMARSMGKCGR